MKKSNIIIIVAISLCSLFVVVKLYQKNIQSWLHQVKMFTKNQKIIDDVIILCENDDDMDTFATKAYSIFEDQIRWALKYQDILKQKPELANNIDEQWMELIYTLGSSLENDSNELRKQKKAVAMEMIGKRINPLMNYLKNTLNLNQEALLQLKN